MRDKSYDKYLLSETWYLKRERYWRTVGARKCQACGSRKLLHVHHKTYERFGGREYMSDLVGLCHVCHIKVHQLSRKMGGKLALATDKFVYLERKKRERLRRQA